MLSAAARERQSTPWCSKRLSSAAINAVESAGDTSERHPFEPADPHRRRNSESGAPW
jgi:hypothetical protein